MKAVKWIAVNGFKLTCVSCMSIYEFWKTWYEEIRPEKDDDNY